MNSGINHPKDKSKLFLPVILSFFCFLFGLVSFPRLLSGISDTSVPSQDKVIECSGKLCPSHHFSLFLLPGERVVSVLVEETKTVQKGTPLVQLANEDLTNQKIVLEEKMLEIEKDRDRLGMLQVKMDMASESIKCLDKQIEEEKKMREKVPDYLIEGKLREWLETKKIKEEGLVILGKEFSIIEKSLNDRSRYQTFLTEKMASVQEQIERLCVKAPFSGRVVRLSVPFERLIKGDPVLELLDDESLHIEAKVWQHQLQQIQAGCKAQIFPGYNQKDFFPGCVRSIGSESISSGEDRFPFFQVILDFDGSGQKGLIPGMVVIIKINKADSKSK